MKELKTFGKEIVGWNLDSRIIGDSFINKWVSFLLEIENDGSFWFFPPLEK